jgi:hypothetical protein
MILNFVAGGNRYRRFFMGVNRSSRPKRCVGRTESPGLKPITSEP